MKTFRQQPVLSCVLIPALLTPLRALWTAFKPSLSQPTAGLPAVFGTALLPVLLFCPGNTAHAVYEDPEIEAAISADQIFIGETIDYQVEIRNTDNPVAPDVSPLKEQFDIVANGDQSRNQSSTFIINGRVSRQSVLSHVYFYRLTPRISGELTIPPVRAMVDGTELISNAVSLRVQEAEQQDLVVLEIHPDRTTVYPTQSFSITLKVLIRPLPDSSADPLAPLRRQPPHLQINWIDVPAGLTAASTSDWLEPLLSQNGTGFTLNEVTAQTGSFLFGGSRAAVLSLKQHRETREGLDGKTVNYFVCELPRLFTAQKTGTCTFGPALVKGTFVGGMTGSEYLARRVVAIAPAVSVDVRDVPTPRPDNFTGGIGEYVVAASASPLHLRVGDPMTLTLEFTQGDNSGSLELLSPPDLTAIEDIAENFDIIDKQPTGRTEAGVKKFSYAMRPKQAGVSIPTITFSSFDPATERFDEIATDPISLDVSAASKLTAGDLIGTTQSAGSQEIRKSAAGIFQNISDPAALRDQRVSVVGWMVVAGGVWCIAGTVIAGVSFYRCKSSDSVGQRRQKARRAAQARLSEAFRMLSQGHSADALRQMRTAVVGLVADTRNRVSEGLTTADVGSELRLADVPQEDLQNVMSLLATIEAAEYGAEVSDDPSALLKSTTTAIERIAPLLERSNG